MHVQIVTYTLQGITEEEYIDVAYQAAPRFSAMPGLDAKLWLENSEANRYGAVYFWQDRESMERFLRSDMFEATNPDFTDVRSEDFDILPRVTLETQPGLEILPALQEKRAMTGPRAGSGGAAASAPPAGKRVAKAAVEQAPAKRTRSLTGATKAAGGRSTAGGPAKAASKTASKTASKSASKTASKSASKTAPETASKAASKRATKAR